ncbi:hypothetical protein AB0X74_01610 [Kurthia gibsonii]|uniref:hypothetical protein n=1 Tax=Kurthia gibsonii TaxID=33946 RepID=UPI003F284117
MSETWNAFFLNVHGYKETDVTLNEKIDAARKRYDALKKAIAPQMENVDNNALKEIYKVISAEELTLNKYVKNLIDNPKKFNRVLMERAIKQSDYYYNSLYKKELNEQMNKNYSMSDVDIEMQMYFIKNCVPLLSNNHHSCKNKLDFCDVNYFFIGYIDVGIDSLKEKIGEFIEILQLVLSSLKSNIIDSNNFSGNLEKQKKTYLKQKKDNELFYTIKTENIYMLFYLYLRNSYILEVEFRNAFPNIYIFGDLDFSEFIFEDKKIYSLKNVATIYANILKGDSDAKNIQENMKKQFQKSEYIQKFKNEKGKYEFSDVKIPIAHYHYFRKKNHSLEGNVSKQVHHLANMIDLNLKVSPDLMNEIESYLKFVNEEFKGIFTSQSIDYQVNMISLLTENMGKALLDSFNLPIFKNGENSL